MSRRLKKVAISPTVWTRLLTEGMSHYFIVKQGLPKDARIVHIDYSIFDDLTYLIVSSETFDAVDEGMALPDLNMVLEDV